MKSRAEFPNYFLHYVLQFSVLLDEAVPEEGSDISCLYLEGARLDEEQGGLVQSLPSVFFTEYYKILCSVLSDEAVPEEGAGISGLYLEGACWYSEQGELTKCFLHCMLQNSLFPAFLDKVWGWCRAFQLFSSLQITNFFFLCL
jgi:hypothetical protein